MLHRLEKIENQKLIVVSFTASTPHLETSLEIFQRLMSRNIIDFAHIGNYVKRPTLYPSNIIKRKFQFPKRIERARQYINQISNNSKSKWLNISIDKKSIINQANIIIKNEIDLNINDINQLRSISWNEYNIGVGIASTIISNLKNPNPFPLNFFERNELREQIRSSIISILIGQQILNDKYDSIIILNGRFTCEHSIKQVAIDKDINIFYHECGSPYPIGRFFFEDYMPHNFKQRKNELLELKKTFPQDHINNIGEEFFMKKTNGEGVYEHSYVKNQKKDYSESLSYIINECKYKNQSIISYFTSSDDEYELIDGEFDRYPFWENQKKAIKEIANICKIYNYYFIVRVHPNLKNKAKKEKDSWQKIGKEIEKMDFKWIDQNNTEPTYKILRESDLIITSGSTIGIEAIFLEKPSIVIAPCKYDSELTGVKLCESIKDLERMLKDRNTFKSPNKNKSLIYGAWAMLYGNKFKFFSHTDYEDGLMTNGIKIASAGNLQKLLSKLKKLLNTYFI